MLIFFSARHSFYILSWDASTHLFISKIYMYKCMQSYIYKLFDMYLM